MNEYYEQYKKLLHRLHDLMVQGIEDGPEADEIRDLMDEPWKHLSETERDSLRKLSATLYKDEELGVFDWLLRHALDTEWQIAHAAEDRYCPYCCKSPEDDWTSMDEHREGCEYIKMMERAKRLSKEMHPHCEMPPYYFET